MRTLANAWRMWCGVETLIDREHLFANSAYLSSRGLGHDPLKVLKRLDLLRNHLGAGRRNVRHHVEVPPGDVVAVTDEGAGVVPVEEVDRGGARILSVREDRTEPRRVGRVSCSATMTEPLPGSRTG